MNINTLTDRRMAYDGDGHEVGYLTLSEARQRYTDVVYEADTGTITVGERRDTPEVL